MELEKSVAPKLPKASRVWRRREVFVRLRSPEVRKFETSVASGNSSGKMYTQQTA